MKVILIGGKKRNGKDSHAKLVNSILLENDVKSEIIHFADPIKRILKDSGLVTGLEENKDLERPYYQKFGNDVMKHWFGDNVWASLAVKMLKECEDRGCEFVFIPDFRYGIEFEMVRSFWDVVTIHVSRLNYENPVDTHSSENSLNDFIFDFDYEAYDMDDVDQNSLSILGRIVARS